MTPLLPPADIMRVIVLDALDKAGAIMLQRLIMQIDAHDVHADATRIAKLLPDRNVIECFGSELGDFCKTHWIIGDLLAELRK